MKKNNEDLAAYWNFDEGSGTKAIDLSGHGNDGVLTNMDESTCWVDGKVGKALSFDGNNDYVIINPVSSTNFPTTEITAVFWMKSSGSNSGTPISYANVTASGGDNTFLIYDYNAFAIFINSQSKATGISATDGKWHHIAVTWKSSNGEVKLYKDGLPAYSETLATGQSIAPGGSLVIGQDQDSVGGSFEFSTQAFSGLIDEVAIYNRALSASEILRIYLATK